MTKKTNKYLNVFIEIILILFLVIGYNYYFFESNIHPRTSIFNLVIFYIVYIFYKSNRKVNKKEKVIPLLFSIIISLVLVIGKKIYLYNSINSLFISSKALLINTITLIGFIKLFTEVLTTIFKKITTLKIKEKLWKIYNHKHFTLILALIIFICWIPYFLAYYPGIASYDAGTQTFQINRGITSFTKFHPPLHTFIYGLCINIGKVTKIDGLALYSIIQMIFIALVLAKLVKFLIDKKTYNWIILLAIMFFTINPVVSIFSMSMTKDVCFAGMFILFIMELYNLITNFDNYLNSYKNIIKWILITVIMCLFRNNAIYVILLFFPIIFIIFRKYYKKLILVLGIPIILYFLINNNLYSFIGIQDGDPKEMLSIPIQQIARIVYKHDNKISNKDKKIIKKFFAYDEIKIKYNYRYADPIKDKFNTDYYIKHKNEFYSLWSKYLLKYPSSYISTFLSLNLPYWYIDADTNDKYAKRVYIETVMRGDDIFLPVRKSKFPWLLTKLEKIESFEFFEKIPLVSTIFSISFPIWFVLFTIFSLLFKKYYKIVLVILPMVFLWLTYIAGPVSNFRYMLPIFLLYPFLLAIIFDNKQKSFSKKDSN